MIKAEFSFCLCTHFVEFLLPLVSNFPEYMRSIPILNSLFIILFISLVSCSENKETVEPLSQAVFTQDRNVVELNEVVSFTNTSSNAIRYEWNFGNGQTSTASDTTISYSKIGTYTITLTAYNDQNIASTTTSTVKVGERYLTGVKINSISFKDRFGANWDLNDGPDLLLLYGYSAGWAFSGSLDLGANYTQAMLPKMIGFETPIKLSNDYWDFQFDDDDSPNYNGFMKLWQINPYSVGQKNYTTGVGAIRLVEGQLDVELIIEIR